MKKLHPSHWTMAQAKSRFDELIEKARHRGPQLITRNDKCIAVVMDATLWKQAQKRDHQGNFADFLFNSPLQGSGLKVSRFKDGLREVDL